MDKVNKENNTSGHMQLDLTYDEVNLLRECVNIPTTQGWVGLRLPSSADDGETSCL